MGRRKIADRGKIVGRKKMVERRQRMIGGAWDGETVRVRQFTGIRMGRDQYDKLLVTANELNLSPGEFVRQAIEKVIGVDIEVIPEKQLKKWSETFSEFLTECCECNPKYKEIGTDLVRAYRAWSATKANQPQKYPEVSKQLLLDELTRSSVVTRVDVRLIDNKIFHGLRLKDDFFPQVYKDEEETKGGKGTT